MIKVTVWNEFVHEKESERVRSIYPEGIHKAIADFLGAEEDIEVRTATLDDEDCGLSEEVLRDTIICTLPPMISTVRASWRTSLVTLWNGSAPV